MTKAERKPILLEADESTRDNYGGLSVNRTCAGSSPGELGEEVLDRDVGNRTRKQALSDIGSRRRSAAKDLTTVKSKVFIKKLLSMAAVLGFGAIVVITTESFILVVAGQILIAAMYAQALELQHQCLHHTAFARKSWNKWVGIPLGWFMLNSYSDFRSGHLHHHRALGTPGDKEFFGYDYGNLRTPLEAFAHFFMLRKWWGKDDDWGVVKNMAEALRGNLRPGLPVSVARAIQVEYLSMLGLIAVAVATSIAFQTTILIELWLIPAVVFGSLIHTLIELPEHVGCNTSSTNVFENTRTIQASQFAMWLTNSNNFHVEHHAAPGVPAENLRLMHESCEEDFAYLETSYPAFYWQFFSETIRRWI